MDSNWRWRLLPLSQAREPGAWTRSFSSTHRDSREESRRPPERQSLDGCDELAGAPP